MLAGAVFVLATGRARARARIRSALAGLRLAEDAERRHSKLLEAILASSSDGIAVVDEQGDSLMHNPAAEDILGTLEDSRTDHWPAHYGVYHADGQTPFPTEERPLVRALAGESSEQVPMFIRNPANPTGAVISVSAQPLNDPGGQSGAVAVFHDVTALREHEAELAAFAGIVAHDLKSPLTAIAGFTEIIRDELPGIPPAAVPWLDRVLATAARMQRLIDDLLVYASARDSPLAATQLDLWPLVDEVVTDQFAAATGANGGCAPKVHIGALPPVHADPVMIRQLFNNLVGNAVKYTPPGQPASVTICTAPTDPGWVRIEISDHGIGIPAGQHQEIFNDFHRAHPGTDYSGTGLGLAICQRIVARHGGQIGVEDNPGGGARFWFTLPYIHTAHRPPGGLSQSRQSTTRA